MIQRTAKQRALAARVWAAVNISEAREKAGLTQGQACELLGMSQAALSRLEAGITPVTVGRLAEISDAYKVPFSQLVEGI